MKALLLTMLLMAVTGGAALADTTTRRGRLSSALADETTAAAPDTLTLAPGAVKPYGYDKPLTATREAVFLTNRSGATLTGVELDITYFDMQGRELHRRRVWVDCNIPPEATRRVEFYTWDARKSFYYHGGKHPRTDRVTPYTVTVTAVRAVTINC